MRPRQVWRKPTKDPLIRFLHANAGNVIKRRLIPVAQESLNPAEEVAQRRAEVAILLRDVLSDLYGLRTAGGYLGEITGYKITYVNWCLGERILPRKFAIECARALLAHINGVRDHLNDLEAKVRRALELLQDSRLNNSKNYPRGGEPIRPRTARGLHLQSKGNWSMK